MGKILENNYFQIKVEEDEHSKQIIKRISEYILRKDIKNVIVFAKSKLNFDYFFKELFLRTNLIFVSDFDSFGKTISDYSKNSQKNEYLILASLNYKKEDLPRDFLSHFIHKMNENEYVSVDYLKLCGRLQSTFFFEEVEIMRFKSFYFPKNLKF